MTSSPAIAEGPSRVSPGSSARALREVEFRGDAVIELAHERDFKPTRSLRESLKMRRSFVKMTLGY